MTRVILVQLPIPQQNFGNRTGNIPLAAACLKQAVADLNNLHVELIPEKHSAYLGDAALIDRIVEKEPDVVGFTVYNWNVKRSIHIAQALKNSRDLKILFGGPEITPDNPLPGLTVADMRICGEGEAAFRQWLQAFSQGSSTTRKELPSDWFQTSPSPYLCGGLEPEIDGMMYLETQRGCPYRCGFCYYNQSREKTIRASQKIVLDAVDWAVQNQVDELCLLDPSLHARPDLAPLLQRIAARNRGQIIPLSGETRAETVDAKTASLFHQAGFTLFEIGLQSTNPAALRLMNRKTDLNHFLCGTSLLKERGITPRIDLIVGLPGDTPDTFRQSVDFVARHDLFDDIMVFPLSVLPGTDFRKNSRQHNLTFDPDPPYTIYQTDTFSPEDILTAFDYAEAVFDIALFPDPRLDVSYRSRPHGGPLQDHMVSIDDRVYISKLLLNPERSLAKIQDLAKRLTHPYQVFIPGNLSDSDRIQKALTVVTRNNPHTPLEVVFLEPESPPDCNRLLNAMALERPGYLDIDLCYLYQSPGNRMVLFTLVSSRPDRFFAGEMKRQVFWWRDSRLPDLEDLQSLSDIDGILIDTPAAPDALQNRQQQLAQIAEQIPMICFADIPLQRRWLRLTDPETVYPGVL